MVSLFVEAIGQVVFIVGFNWVIIMSKNACLNGCVWVLFHQVNKVEIWDLFWSITGLGVVFDV